MNHGTIIEISHLRDTWDRSRILKLKQSLAKLINPNQDNDSNNFIIEIVAKDELKVDALQREDINKVNGIVKNQRLFCLCEPLLFGRCHQGFVQPIPP